MLSFVDMVILICLNMKQSIVTRRKTKNTNQDLQSLAWIDEAMSALLAYTRTIEAQHNSLQVELNEVIRKLEMTLAKHNIPLPRKRSSLSSNCS